MPQKSAFLGLTLPLLDEFVDSWNDPLNQNFETIDGFLQDLQFALIGGGTPSSRFSALFGTIDNLADRLNVSINADGSLSLSGSPEIASLGSSATNGLMDSPRTRFDYSDLETWNARAPIYGDRFNPSATAQGLLDVGIAMRTRERGAFDSAHPISNPDRSFVSGLVQGSDAFLVGVAPNLVKFDSTIGSPSSWPAFNVDGFLFRIRQAVILDLTKDVAGTILSNGDIVYLYVSRIDYNNANQPVKLATDSGITVARDLRKLQNGTDGIISGQIFSSASALFNGSASKWQILPGDLLVIDSGAAAGSYVIGSVPSPTSLQILGTFKADALTNVVWHIEDDAHPNIGCIKVADAMTDPPYVPGRTYVGRGQLDAGNFRPVGGSPFTKIAFPVSGVYDSGWVTAIGTGSFPLTFEHNLGVIPSSIEVLVQDSSADDVFSPPTVVRQILVDFDTSHDPVLSTDPKKANLRLPSMIWRSNRQRTIVQLSADSPNALPHLYTKEDDTTNVDTGQIRLIARR